LLNISFDELVLVPRQAITKEIEESLAESVRTSNNCAQMNEKSGKSLFSGCYLDHQASDIIVKVDGARLPLNGVRIFLVSVLIGVVVADCALMIPGGDDIQVVMDRPSCVFGNCPVLQQVDLCLGVVFLQLLNVVLGSEVEFVDCVGYV